jgi:hypothetical protein
VVRDAVEKLYTSVAGRDFMGSNIAEYLMLHRLARVLLGWARVQPDWKRAVSARDRGEKVMSDETNLPGTETTSRRDLVKKSAQVAVTAPAVAMLLNASTKQAFAQAVPYNAVASHILDDFTFGNNEEDIDALHQGSNFNFLNQTPQQDDHI